MPSTKNTKTGDIGYRLQETAKSQRSLKYQTIRVFRDECKSLKERILFIAGVDENEYDSLIQEFEITEEDPD